MILRARLFLVPGLALLFAGVAHPAVTADEAKQLGTTLTLVGAEKAGNTDGTIPAYMGGLTAPPAGFAVGKSRPDPFANDKPLFSIDAKNVDQYAGKLTEGTKALMKKFPTYRADVYPTRRSVAFPKFVTDFTLKNATTVKTADDGLVLENATGGVPFPIPKTGNEAMWNHLVAFQGYGYRMNFKSFNVDASGTVILAAAGPNWQEFPYHDPKGATSDLYWKLKSEFAEPARRAGEITMIQDPLNQVVKGRRAWSYLPGQRRVRLAPDVAYDTPNPAMGGAGTYDDLKIFNGKMDRFDFKLAGKKELYVPYNAYRICYNSTQADLFKPNFVNPDLVRWELHRVWVVEATLKPDKRHIYHKRVFYLDEDSWLALAADTYDARDQLFRASFAYLCPSYEVPAPFADLLTFYDLNSGMYTLNGWSAPAGPLQGEMRPERDWTPDAMAGAGIR